MGIIRFPTIPEAFNNQVLSATQLMAYKKAVSYLLGESHALTPMLHWHGMREVNSSYWTTVWEGWLYHRAGAKIHPYMELSETHGGTRTWHARVTYWDNSGHEQAFQEWSGTEITPYPRIIDQDYDAPSGLTDGKLYRWSVQLRADSGDYHSRVYFHAFYEQMHCDDLWQPLPTFTATTSDPAQLEKLRVDLNALYTRMVPPVHPLKPIGAKSIATTTNFNWQNYTEWIYAYRPQELTVAFCYLMDSGTGSRTMEWRIDVKDMGAGDTYRRATIWGSGVLGTNGGDEWRWVNNLDLQSGAAAAALTAAGITLTFGNFYRVSIEFRRVQTSEVLHGYYALGAHLNHPSHPPAAGWQTLRDWEHGVTEVSPANLNALVTDINMLKSGAEALWGQVHHSRYNEGSASWHTGWHRKRWLCYRHPSGASPAIHYGGGFGWGVNLPTGTGWINYDTLEARLPWGGPIMVSGVSTCVESDVPVS